MRKQVTASFEGDEVKLIHSSTKFNVVLKKWQIVYAEKWNIAHITRKEVVAESEFNAYLDSENTEEYTVVCDFDEYSHGVLLIPSLKPKFIRNVVESEIRKATQQTDFTFVYSVLGEKVVDNKKMIEIFYYMVPNKAVNRVTDRFHERGKIVKALYPAVFAAASFVDFKGSDKVKMGVLFSGKRRVIFTTTNGIINFVRDYESIEMSAAGSEFDIQNINMTLAYCSENLNIEPSSVTFVGNVKGVSALNNRLSVPVSFPDMIPNIQCDGMVDCDYSLPCSALNISRNNSILTERSKNIYIMRRILEGVSLVFILLSMVYFLLIVFVAKDVYQTRKELSSVISEIAGVERSFAEFQARQETMDSIVPLVDFLNAPSIDIEPFFIEMSGIELKDLRLDEVNAVKNGETSFTVSIRGKGITDTHAAFHASIDNLVKRLEKMTNVELKNKEINHMGMTFLVQLHYGE